MPRNQYGYTRQAKEVDFGLLRRALDYLQITKAEEAAVLVTLRDARAGVADPTRWCIRTMATTEQGTPTDVMHSGATKFCAVGHVQHSFLTRYRYKAPMSIQTDETVRPITIANHLLDAVANQLWGAYIVQVNDHIGREAVVECFDAAITFAGGDV